MFKKTKIIITAFSILFLLGSSPLLVRANTTTLVPQGSAYDTGNYQLNDLVQVGVNVTQIILGIVGSLALLMFVYGGLVMLISAGNSEKVTQAKNILVASAIGLAIVFASYIIIQFVMGALGVNWDGGIKFIVK